MKNRRYATRKGIAIALCGSSLLAALLLMPASHPTASAQTGPTPTFTPSPTPASKLRGLLKGSTTKSTDPNGTVAAEVTLPKDGAIWAGNAFELKLQDAVDFSFRFRVSRLNPDLNNLELVYDHTENNKPFCPFGDSNGKCNSLPEKNGAPFWPDSDAGKGQPVKAGDYVLEVNGLPKDPTGSGAWQRDLNNENAIFFTIDLQRVNDVPRDLPPLTGTASIAAPPNGSTFTGVVNIRGTANSNNFGLYKFELLDSRCQNGVCFMIDFKRPVSNGVLWRWNTRQPLPNGAILPNGNYVMQMVVVDKFGRVLPNAPQLQFTINN